jgi:hypothetical protein
MRKAREPRARRAVSTELADFEQRPGGDYAELLRRGQVVSPPGVDIEAWRAEIRAKARADKIRVATIRDGEVAIAIRQREYSDAEVRAELERGECMWGLGAQARELGHELSPWLRQDDESIAFCTRCTAHLVRTRWGRSPGRSGWGAPRCMSTSVTFRRWTASTVGRSMSWRRRGEGASVARSSS